MPLLFEDAAKVKDAIMVSQQKEIQKLYDEWAKDIADRAKFYSHKTNASAAVSERYYKELYAQMKEQSNQVGKEIQGIITSNMYTIADAVVASNVNWLKEFGFSEDGLNAAFSYIPNDVVQRLITGQIYQGGWNLSQRIWSDSQQTQRDVYQIMARGLAEQKSVYEIAKDLESYVKPSARLPWNPVIAMKNTKTGQIEYKRIYKKQVDYNAQRLARTLAQHSYQQSFIATTQNNPFITEYVWHSNGSRVCSLCRSRDGVTFKKTELPMDHPNGMCVMEPVVVKDMVDQLANWFNSPDGTYPEIDAFAGNFGYEAKPVNKALDFVNKYGMSTKSPSAWYNSLNKIQKAEAKVLKDASGLNWNDWYEQNIHSTGDANLDFVKKYGTSTKSPNAWFNSLTDAQKTEAKALKDASGLTWNKWYEKYVHAGSTTTTTAKTATKTVQQTAKAFSPAQDKYLSPYGFSPTNMPKNFDDWSHKISYDQAAEILKSMGTSWSDPHPYQQLMKYYNANLTSAKLASQTVTKATATKAATTTATKVATKVDDAIDTASWFNKIKSQDEDHMLELEKEAMKLIGEAGRKGIRTYSGSSYQEMNAYLRYVVSGMDEAEAIRRSNISNHQLMSVKNAIAGLDNAKLVEDLVLRRGTDLGDLAGAFMTGDFSENKRSLYGKSVEELNNMFAGAVGKLGSFTSTSSLWDRGFSGSVEIVFYAPKGTSASSIMSISNFGTSEGETLLNAGTTVKCLRVEQSDGHMGSKIRVFMEIIPK